MTSGSTVLLLCPSGYFTGLNQLCQVCPTGAACDGGFSLPAALTGYFPVSATAFVQCTPVEACLGGLNATCSALYTGPRCGDCAVGAYR